MRTLLTTEQLLHETVRSIVQKDEDKTLIEITTHSDLGIPCIQLCGRMDSMTSNEVQKSLNELILQGTRKFLVDLENVSYLSSAGLRVFMSAQKQLKKVDGELLFFKPSAQVTEVFQLSGFSSFFRIIHTEAECSAFMREQTGAAAIQTQEIDGVVFRSLLWYSAKGTWIEMGSQHKLAESGYGEEDVVALRANEIQFGTGLATLGDSYDEFKHYFGEAVILNHNFFFYPAVKHPAVDFMLCQDENAGMEYKFLHGFGFGGEFSSLVSFETQDRFVSLADLSAKLFFLTKANALGVVLLAESKGLWGMNLRRVPIRDHQPANGGEIFDPEHFPVWMNFPIEPTDINHIVAASGLCVRNRQAAAPALQRVLGKDQTFHFHGAVFEKEPLTQNCQQFPGELKRVITEMDVYKVQHLLGQSVFSSGLLGLIELV